MAPQPDHHPQFPVELEEKPPALFAAIVPDVFDEFIVGNAAVLSLAGPDIGGCPQDGVNLSRKLPRGF
jgi:hypothetical protein